MFPRRNDPVPLTILRALMRLCASPFVAIRIHKDYFAIHKADPFKNCETKPDLPSFILFYLKWNILSNRRRIYIYIFSFLILDKFNSTRFNSERWQIFVNDPLIYQKSLLLQESIYITFFPFETVERNCGGWMKEERFSWRLENESEERIHRDSGSRLNWYLDV